MLFDPLLFAAGLAIGAVLVYFVKPEIPTFYKYPHPDNVGKVTYKDRNGICYQYTADEVQCDNSKAKSIPIQS